MPSLLFVVFCCRLLYVAVCCLLLFVLTFVVVSYIFLCFNVCRGCLLGYFLCYCDVVLCVVFVLRFVKFLHVFL